MQDSTWQQVRGGFIDLPKNNPGPGTYSTDNFNRTDAGWGFS